MKANKKVLAVLFLTLVIANCVSAATTTRILTDINITDIRYSIVEIIGIIAPVLFAFIVPVIAYAVMTIVFGVGSFPIELMDKMLKRLTI